MPSPTQPANTFAASKDRLFGAAYDLPPAPVPTAIHGFVVTAQRQHHAVLGAHCFRPRRASDEPGTLARAFAFLGLPAPDGTVRPTTRRLADETNAALKAGYLAAIGAA